MGRKIPAKKHRGVKDPLVQQARRLQSLKGKINVPPKDPDDQPVPKSLTRLFAFQNRDKTIKKKNNKKLRSTGGVKQFGGSSNPVASLKKLPGESGRGFSLRINSAMRALHNPLDQQDYPDDIESEDEKGERMSAQRERRRRKRGGATDADSAGGRARRLALLKREKKSKALEEAARARRAEAQYERVQFGDVAHAPPALRAPRNARPAPKPARRGLLLAAQLAGGAEQRGAEQRGAEQRGAEQRGAEQRGAEQRGAEQRGAEQRGAEQRGAEQRGAEQRGAEQRGAEQRERARVAAVAAYRALNRERRRQPAA